MIKKKKNIWHDVLHGTRDAKTADWAALYILTVRFSREQCQCWHYLVPLRICCRPNRRVPTSSPAFSTFIGQYLTRVAEPLVYVVDQRVGRRGGGGEHFVASLRKKILSWKLRYQYKHWDIFALKILLDNRNEAFPKISVAPANTGHLRHFSPQRYCHWRSLKKVQHLAVAWKL